MDIHLSDGSAFNIFELMEVEVPIIFTTAYDQYAIDAFKVNSVDYLLKPVKPEALAEALAKFRRFSQSDVKMYLERLMELRPEARYPERMLLRLKDKLIPIAVENVAFVYTADRSTQVYMNDGMCYTSEKSMEQIAPAVYSPIPGSAANSSINFPIWPLYISIRTKILQVHLSFCS